ncbi:MAG TPA: hypothetical protein VFO00_08395 [Vitreimonas sp.]|nr:hypothetical protein [Vitreimonas sp.]
MPVVLSHNETLELNLAEYTGIITIAQLTQVAGFGAKHPDFLKADTLNVVHANTDFSAVDLGELDALFARYKALFAPLNFQIYRRSAWLCLNKVAVPHVDYWLGEHDMREAMSSAVRKFETYTEAGDWLLLSPAELALVERGEGFTELAAFDDAPALPRAAAR